MRILGAHHVIAGDVVEFVAAEAIHHTRGNVQRAQHHGHRRGKVLAVSLLAFEKEIGQWIRHRRPRQLQRISVVPPQISFQRHRLVIVVGSGTGDLCRQLPNARIERRRCLQIGQGKWRKIISRPAKLLGRRRRYIGIRLVQADGALAIEIGHRTARVDLQLAIRPTHPACPGSEKKNVGADRFHQHPVMNQVFGLSRRRWISRRSRGDSLTEKRNSKCSIRLPPQRHLLRRV